MISSNKEIQNDHELSNKSNVLPAVPHDLQRQLFLKSNYFFSIWPIFQSFKCVNLIRVFLNDDTLQ